MTTEQTFRPAYLNLHASGELAKRAATAHQALACCRLCPRNCGVDRFRHPQAGACRTGAEASVASFGPHFGEEGPLVGRNGSGTIFFARCNLHCVFCQNWELSQRDEGRVHTAAQLAEVMVHLQRQGCHNINLVSPSHVVPAFLEALVLAADRGLKLPLVYNSGGYDSLETLALLEGVVDIYMPDMKFFASAKARPFLGVDDYAEINQAAVRAMFDQVGHLQVEGGGLLSRGIARRGLLIRHLVLPADLAGTSELLPYLARELGTETCLNLMNQYRPCYLAADHPPLDRRLSRAEFAAAADLARNLGLRLV